MTVTVVCELFCLCHAEEQLPAIHRPQSFHLLIYSYLFRQDTGVMIMKCVLLLAATAIQLVSAQLAPRENSSDGYTNPVLSTVGADPWVTQCDGWYYMTYTTNDNITMLRSKRLTDWNSAESKLAFKPQPGLNYSTDLWAPELHRIDSKWYIIFTADPRADSPPPEVDMYCPYSCPAVNHRMYVLENSNSNPWEGKWEMKGELNTYDQFAIDGTYFQHSTGLYHVYSCWQQKYDGWPANLCITKSRRLPKQPRKID